jgi:pyruvate dehydrogenase E2 component (dihydrolipoamide acetyltransferase)
MPILGADMTAGTLTAWRKKPGDRVARGDIIAEVETDKGLIDVEVYVGGVIERLLVEPGTTVPTGTPLAILREDVVTALPSTAEVAPAVPAAAPTTAPLLAPPPPPVPAAAPAATRVRVTPLARKRAAELGIDPTAVEATGPDGAVTHEDIERAAARAAAGPGVGPTPSGVGPSPGAVAPAPGTVQPARGKVDSARLRQIIAAAMTRSKREIPHYYLAQTIDMHRAMRWLGDENGRRPVTERLLYGILLVKAVALALHDVPELNAVWRGDRADPSPAVHVGVAISLRGGGLIAPALHDVDRRPVGELMRALRDLVQRARTGGLRSSELSDPTITVTSLGEQGVETVLGVVYPPQVAIVGFGRVVERPWVVDGAVVARPLVTATLSADHRVSDGHRGGLFLAAVDRLLQAPERL